VSNILGVKLFAVGEFMLPAAVIVYMATFLITDVIGEVYGKKNARRTVQAGFFTQVVVLFFIYLAIELPPAPAFTMQAEYEMILGGSFRVIVASLVSYMVSQHLHVSIFHRLKGRHGVRKLWLRNNVLAGVIQHVVSSKFFLISFFGSLLFEAMSCMFAVQYVDMMVIVLFDTPIVYLLDRNARGRKREYVGYDVHM